LIAKLEVGLGLADEHLAITENVFVVAVGGVGQLPSSARGRSQEHLPGDACVDRPLSF
jgi:hypothetical protein